MCRNPPINPRFQLVLFEVGGIFNKGLKKDKIMIYIITSILSAILAMAWLVLFYSLHQDNRKQSLWRQKRQLESDKYNKGL